MRLVVRRRAISLVQGLQGRLEALAEAFGDAFFGVPGARSNSRGEPPRPRYRGRVRPNSIAVPQERSVAVARPCNPKWSVFAQNRSLAYPSRATGERVHLPFDGLMSTGICRYRPTTQGIRNGGGDRSVPDPFATLWPCQRCTSGKTAGCDIGEPRGFVAEVRWKRQRGPQRLRTAGLWRGLRGG